MEEQIHQNTEQRLNRLFEASDAGSLNKLKRMLSAMHPAEIAHFLESSPITKRHIVWDLIGIESEGEILIEVSDEVRNSIVDEMESEDLLKSLQSLEVDDIADILQSLPEGLTQVTLNGMSRQQRERVETVLAYDEDTAGGMMSTSTLTTRANVSVDVVLRYLRLQDDLLPLSDSLFIIDKYDTYIGVLAISKLLTSQPDEMIRDIFNESPAIVDHMASNEVAQLFEDRNYVSAPVVNKHNKLIGRITIDDVVDVIRDESEQSMMNMAGLDGEEDLFAPVLSSVKRRALWLGANLLTAFLAAWVISQFSRTIEEAVALAVLMGIVPSMGGIAGSQTLTLVIRSLALGQISKANTHSLLKNEILLGLINGIIWASIVFAISAFAFNDYSIGIVIGIAMLLNLLIAPLVGVILPIALRKFGIDPALAGSVLLTTATDVVGYTAVLGFATLLLPFLRNI